MPQDSTQARWHRAIRLLCVALIGCVLVWPAAPHLKLDKDQAAFWDVALKAIAGVVAALGAWITLRKYFHENAKDRDAALLEAGKPFRLKRQEVYYELVTVTSRLANKSRDDKSRKPDEDEFWQLYWGPVPLVADLIVGQAVNRFSKLVDERQAGPPLLNASMALALACRDSLEFTAPDVSRVPRLPDGTTWANPA